MAFAKQGMQSSASIAVNYLEPSSSLGWNGLTISRVNPYRVAQPSATSWERHKCIRCMPTSGARSDRNRWAKSEADWRGAPKCKHRYSMSPAPATSTSSSYSDCAQPECDRCIGTRNFEFEIETECVAPDFPGPGSVG